MQGQECHLLRKVLEIGLARERHFGQERGRIGTKGHGKSPQEIKRTQAARVGHGVGDQRGE
jgi:hypothetical protein